MNPELDTSSAQPRRLFLAVQLPPAVEQSLAPLRHALNGGPVRLRAAASPLHVTLHFFGATDPAAEHLIRQATGVAATSLSPFSFHLGGLGSFPSRRAPRVIWIGVSEGVEGVRSLHENVERALEHAGIPRAETAYRPHVTLARVAGRPVPADLEHLAAQLAHVPVPPLPDVRVRSLTLFESRLSASGSHYEAVGEWALGA